MNNTNILKIEEEIKVFYSELEKYSSLEEILKFEKKYLKGKDSFFNSWFLILKDLNNNEEKSKFGKKINVWKNKILDLIEKRKKEFFFINESRKSKKINNNPFIKNHKIGSFHLIKKSLSEIYQFFISRGYGIFESQEIENKWYNFDSLNLEQNHPARKWSDTFYFSKDSNVLLRTHSSSSQARVMERNINKEIMVVSSAKVYRNDDDDLTHSHQYTNLEIIKVGKKVSFANLKWALEDFFQWFFKRDLKTRFRPSFFPFTEPSFEVDVSCFLCSDSNSIDCKVCKGTSWIEILGAGLINPIVLKNSGYNEKEFSGFAAGIGVERILMIKYKINDIRDFYLNDPRFLKQFN